MFQFVLVVWYGLVNVPGLFSTKQSRHIPGVRDLWKSTLFRKVHYVGYSDIKIKFKSLRYFICNGFSLEISHLLVLNTEMKYCAVEY